jgi:hypothetical protein
MRREKVLPWKAMLTISGNREVTLVKAPPLGPLFFISALAGDLSWMLTLEA